MTKVRYLVEKPGTHGPRWFWQPSAQLRARGWKSKRLAASTEAEAMQLAEAINAELDEKEGPAVRKLGRLPPAVAAAVRRGDVEPGGRPYLYVLGSLGGTQKIGISRWPEKRCRDLETASGRRLEIWLLIGGRRSHAQRLEALAHAILSEHRREGEWFAVPPDVAITAVVEALASLREPIENTVRTTEV